MLYGALFLIAVMAVVLTALVFAAVVYGGLGLAIVASLAQLGVVEFSWTLVAGVAAVIAALSVVFGGQ